MSHTRFVLAILCLAACPLAKCSGAAGAADAQLMVQDLPRHPEATCASQQVRTALASCLVYPPSAVCCNKVDQLYAGSSSPSARCLCYPRVLYATITQAAKSGINLLGILQTCKGKNPTSFNTQWATGTNSTCPDIPLDARTGDFILNLGDAAVLPGGVTSPRPEWALGNILQFGELMGEVTDVRSVSDTMLGMRVLQFNYIVIICMPFVFALLHFGVLSRLSKVYKQCTDANRFITCQHAVYAVVFGLSLVPQTTLAVRVFFKAWTGDYLASPELSVLLGVFATTRAVLYTTEAAVRSVVKPSWLLLLHHSIFFALLVMLLWCQNAVVMGMGLVLELFACHEAPLYVSLVAYRLQWPPKLARTILRSACAWYIITRIVQTVLLVYMIVGFAGMPAVRYSPQFIGTAILAGVLTVLQVYTLVIYRGMDVKLCKRTAASAGHGSLPPLPATTAKLPMGSSTDSQSGDLAVDLELNMPDSKDAAASG